MLLQRPGLVAFFCQKRNNYETEHTAPFIGTNIIYAVNSEILKANQPETEQMDGMLAMLQIADVNKNKRPGANEDRFVGNFESQIATLQQVVKSRCEISSFTTLNINMFWTYYEKYLKLQAQYSY